MATILLSAVGAAAGASLGGSVLGISAAALGRAAGATIGRVIDAKILGAGSPAVETGRIDRIRVTGASEGAPVAQVHGRIRVAGQVIWASHFNEVVTESGGGGKGAPSQPTVRSFSYSVSLAIALCEGEITRVGRIWADGNEIDPSDLNLRIYKGRADQLPDPKMEAIEGAGAVPAYRGTAYVVIEDLDLSPFGNRVPQFTFEVVRSGVGDPAEHVRAVALIPGTGEYALATTPVHFEDGLGAARSANVNTLSGGTDFEASLVAMVEELPACGATSLIISWFGDDLRCGDCTIRPKVEQTVQDGVGQPWEVSGVVRAVADTVPLTGGRPVYGGTPSDASVKEAIAALNASGQAVMFYPFVLMDQMEGNVLPDPWSGGQGQPHLPWRGRITTSLAQGLAGSPDATAAAVAEVEAFFGSATAADFVIDGGEVAYVGADGFTYRRFILHYAALCAVAGGVESFCIGSEMRGLTQIRGNGGSFPAVQELIELAAEVRAILGPEVKIGYAADWSEYFGYQPQDGSGDVYFHLDPLWASDDIDFVGIDNYMPLSDWRDGADHADAAWGSIYNPAYLKANIAGGEGFDWYYKTPSAEVLQVRTAIEDDAHGEPWVFRYKDLASWWGNAHHERIGGVRQAASTPWVPGSKPIWFTEVGCAAIDKGTNQPNRFLDPKSSESGLPKYSNGARDDLLQMQFLRAVSEFWDDPANNPEATLYSGRMLDTGRMFVWAWDARPYPQFPGNASLWSDGDNYARGHWLSGRVSNRSLAGVVRELCARAGVTAVNVDELFGLVRGYRLEGHEDARSALQPLLLAAGADVTERNGALHFRNRAARPRVEIGADDLADMGAGARVVQTRDPAIDVPGRVRLSFVEADGSYEVRTDESRFPDVAARTTSQSELPMVMTAAEGRQATDRWLSEVRVARDLVRFAVPPSFDLFAGDVVELTTGEADGLFRVDRIEEDGARLAEAVRIEPGIYDRTPEPEPVVPVPPIVAPLPVLPIIMDLPLLGGDDDPNAPWVAAVAAPWPGSVAVYGSADGADWRFELVMDRPALIGETLSELPAATVGLIDRGPGLSVRMPGGTLSSISQTALLNGGNALAIGDPARDAWEIIQFRKAELTGTDTWSLSERLRGLRGTDGIQPQTWPIGSTVVVLDGRLRPLSLSPAQRGLERLYRVGPSAKPVDHTAYRELTHQADAIGLRPYRPVHLKARQSGGDILVGWTRQTRIDGDLWDGMDVPLGEASEAYLVRVLSGVSVIREVTVTSPEWIYTAADQLADGASGAMTVDVAQISDRFGPGLSGKVEINV